MATIRCWHGHFRFATQLRHSRKRRTCNDLTVDFNGPRRYARKLATAVRILLNGEPHELPTPLTIEALLHSLGIDGRRVAVERNLTVVRRAHYPTELVGDGDEVEIVNFVGGG